jgi:hypothetical protein
VSGLNKQSTKESFKKKSSQDGSLVRYILDGTANVQVTTMVDKKQVVVSPGNLLEVKGEATLKWQVTSEEMILLTPGFEQTGLFVGVLIGSVLVLAALIALS